MSYYQICLAIVLVIWTSAVDLDVYKSSYKNITLHAYMYVCAYIYVGQTYMYTYTV